MAWTAISSVSISEEPVSVKGIYKNSLPCVGLGGIGLPAVSPRFSDALKDANQ